MKTSTPNRALCAILAGVVLAGITCIGSSARAQEGRGGGYTVGEDREEHVPSGGDTAEEGPVRLARFSYVQGNVTWRDDDGAEWSAATNNLPLRQGAQIWVSDGGRAEIQFDDGSLLRLGNGAVATLQTLYSDADGEFTEIKLTDGLTAIRLKHERSVFQIDTPLVSVKSVGPSRLRIGAADGVEIGVRTGAATVEGAQGKADLKRGDYLDLANSDALFDVRALPRDDSWEQWNDERDDEIAAADNDNREHQLAPNIALVAGDLSSNGDWQQEPDYGWVWCPRTTVVDWRPYQYGHWTWVNPFGWTWVSDESWGWAPYHYGTWARLHNRWAWVPGPVTQCWSPAVVHFTECDNRVAWCPLAPSEVRYSASLAFGIRGRSWSAYFSIGHAAVYYPTSGGYCAPTVFSTKFVNHHGYAGNANHGFGFNGPSSTSRFRSSNEFFAANSNTYLNNRFVPVNSRTASGVTAAETAAFGGRGRYEAVGQTGSGLFQRGQGVGAPPAGHSPAGGPSGLKPTLQALTPTRTYLTDRHGIDNIANRPIYRAPLKPAVEHASAPVRALPFNPAGTRTPSERPGVLGGRTQTPAQPDRIGRQGEHGGVLPGTGGNSITPGTRGDTGSDREAARLRAREARRALGAGSDPARTDNTPRRTSAPVAGGGTSSERIPGGFGRRGDSPASDPAQNTPRRYTEPDRGRIPPAIPPPDTRRSDTPQYPGRNRVPDAPRSPEPRRDPTPPAEPRRTAPAEPRRESPQSPGRTYEPRRDPAPQPPVRREEPRRDPAPQPPAPHRDPAPQAPARIPEQRREPAPEPRRSPPADPPRREKEQPKSEDKPADKTPPSGGGGRSRR